MVASFAAGQTRLAIDEDFTSANSSAETLQDAGKFTPEGWLVTSEKCQMKWDLGRFYEKGIVEFEVKGPLAQQPKRSLFSAWNEEAAADGDRKTQGFFQLRVMEQGMMLRLTFRAGGRSFEGKTGPLDWEDKWYRVKGEWDTNGGLCRLWRDGELLSEGKFNSEFKGLRWMFIGKDNYQSFVSIPGLVYRNLKVWVDK
jgi:hypothetical protein